MNDRPSTAGPSFTFYKAKSPYYNHYSDEATTGQEVVTYRKKSRKPRESWLKRESQRSNLLVQTQDGSEYTLLKQVSVQALSDGENLRHLHQQHRRVYVEEGSFSTDQETTNQLMTYSKSWQEMQNVQKRQTIHMMSVYEAAHVGDLARVQQLIRRFPEMVNSRNDQGFTLLHIAAQSGRVEILKWLVANDAELDAESRNGYTPLHVCAAKGNLTCMRILVAMGANIDYISPDTKQTPLHLALMKGNVECIKWLIANRASITLKDGNDCTPKMLSEKYGYTEITEFLKAVEEGMSDPKNIFTLLRTNSYTSKTVYQNNQEKEIISVDKALFTSNFTSEFVIHDIKTGSVTAMYQPVDLTLPVKPSYQITEVIINFPSGKREHLNIHDNRDGTVTVRFQPTEIGLHELYVIYNNNVREERPILFVVNSVTSCEYLKAYGHGLCHGVIGEPSAFTLVMKDSDIGTPLQISFGRETRTGTAQTLPPPQDQPDDVESRCEFCLNIPVAEKDIKSDLIFAIDASGSVGKPNFDKELDFCIKFAQDYPIGKGQVQCSVLTFGNDVVNHFYLNQHYTKSALIDAINAVKDKYPSKNRTQTAMALKYIRENSLLPANGAQTDCKKFVIILTDGASTNKNDTFQEAALLKKCKDVSVVSVGIGDNLNKGELQAMASNTDLLFMSPTFEALKSVSEEIKRYTSGSWNIRMSSLNQQNGAKATFKISCTFPFDLKASVKSPSGADVKCDVNKISSNQYTVDFEPSESGVHKVIALDKTTAIPGSPFQFKIDPMAITKKGPKLETVQFLQTKAEIKPCQFNVFARPAGSGDTTIVIEGPSKALLKFDQRQQNGICGVTYTVSEPGEYTISIKNNNRHITNSPFKARFTGKCSYIFCNCKTFREA